MIRPEDRFWVSVERVSGDFHSTDIIDWDQRRWYTVDGSTQSYPPDEELEIDVLKRHIDQLAPNVYSISVDKDGLLVSVSSIPDDDGTLVPHYLRYSELPSLQNCSTIELTKLSELDRLGPQVDLVSYEDELGNQRKAVFKYSIIYKRMEAIWNELHLLKSLPQHENLVPFDRVVIDNLEARVLGFTTKYVAGGTLDENRSRCFQLRWLKQLTKVVDYLNNERGIIHQDVAPRNLLIDENDNLRLFDFDRSARIDQPGCIPQRNDIAGVIFTLYEIITEDDHYRRVPFEEQDAETVQRLESWPVKCKLDCDIALFRQHLNDWVQERKNTQPTHDLEIAADPPMPLPSPLLMCYDFNGDPVIQPARGRKRPVAIKFKQHVVMWERPPQQLTVNGNSCERHRD